MKTRSHIRKTLKKLVTLKKSSIIFLKSFFWFSIGVFLGIFFLLSFVFIYFEKKYSNLVYPGVMVGAIDFGGKSKSEVEKYFKEKNGKIAKSKFVFKEGKDAITLTAEQIELGYNEELLAKQAFEIGRSDNIFSNITLILEGNLNGVILAPSYKYSEKKVFEFLSRVIEKNKIPPQDALFKFQDNKVATFKPSKDGQELDVEALKKDISSNITNVLFSQNPKTITINLKIKKVLPKVTTDKVNSLGIKELVANGTSLFQHSIPNRIYNITLASTRLNGILIAPNEIFSFNKAIGDISAFTGYKQAYVIQNGRTVLGDGGGVCQVSTTLFRAALNAGLPITERTAHAYRVGYYEQDSGPGLDATVYSPSVDLKFKNDTGNYLLIQTEIDPNEQRLTFYLYGTKDGREAVVSKPVITSQTPPLPTVYQDDPTLPKGVVKQVDYEAWGANVYFTRVVKKNGKTIINDKFVSNYRSWQAVFLRGTKE